MVDSLIFLFCFPCLWFFFFWGGNGREREERLIKPFSYILHADQEWASLENTTEINNARLVRLQQQGTETDEKQNQDTLPSYYLQNLGCKLLLSRGTAQKPG